MTVHFLVRMGRYCSAAPLPAATGFCCVAVSAFLGSGAFRFFKEENPREFVVFLTIALGWAGLAFFALADSLSRYRDYLRMRRLFMRYGFQPRILQKAAGSRCQRDAALAAASHAGYPDHAKVYFSSLGYRWYHLLPDRVVANPLVFFSPRFILTAYFSKGLKRRASED